MKSTDIKALVGQKFEKDGLVYEARSVAKFHGNKYLVLIAGTVTVYADPSRLERNGYKSVAAKAKPQTIEDKLSSEGLRAIAHAFADYGQRFFVTSGLLKASESGVEYAKTGKVYDLVDTERLAGGLIQVCVSCNGHTGLIYSDPQAHESFMCWCA